MVKNWISKKRTYLGEICQSTSKIIVFRPRSSNIHNFKKTTTEQYAVVRGATFDTHIDMLGKKWWLLISRPIRAKSDPFKKKIFLKNFINFFVSSIEQFLLRVGNLWKKLYCPTRAENFRMKYPDIPSNN